MFCLALLALLAAGPATAKDGAYGDYVKAARLLGSWQYDEARVLIEKLAGEHPGTPETRYLLGELAFYDGDYGKTIELLDGLDDKAVYGNVGPLRHLAASTYETTKDFEARESSGGHFVIYYAAGKDRYIADLAGDVLEAAYEALGDDFGYRPTDKIRVELLGRPSDLASVSTLTESEIETTGTIALCKYGKLMVVTPRATVFGYPWMDTLTHEYAHYVVSRVSHDKVPVWLHEGLARYEQVRWKQPAEGKLSRTDEHLLATALAKRALISFDDMHPSMAKLPSQEAAALAFAEVHTMIAYVHDRAGYAGIRKAIELIRDGKSARRGVAEALDTRWYKVEKGWRKYLKTSKLQAHSGLAGKAGKRIKFRRGESDDENVGVDRVSSKAARKFTRLGGMLRARGMPRAAAVEYEKALAIVGSDDSFVAGKLSRTYLDLQQYERAIELAKPLAQADPTDATLQTTLGVAYRETGDNSAARAAFEASLEVSPFDPTVRCGLARVYESLAVADLQKREEAACGGLMR